MTALSDPDHRTPALPWAVLTGLAALLVTELAAIRIAFKHLVAFDCAQSWSETACTTGSLMLVGLYCVIGGLTLILMLRPAPFRALLAGAAFRSGPLLMNVTGLALSLVPLSFLVEGQAETMVLPAFGFWTLGMGLILGGLALCTAAPTRWLSFLSETKSALIPALLVGASAPWLAVQMQPSWRIESIADVTFAAVNWIVTALGYVVATDVPTKTIGDAGFSIIIAPSCSGIEGLALTTLFVSLYLWLFRGDLRFPRALLLYPIGLAASATFNIIRISLLLVIGLEGNPDLAIGGFHSHAGWLMFTLVALGIIALAQNVAWLKRGPDKVAAAPKVAPLPFWRDPMVARILPFAVLMMVALLTSAFFEAPGVAYPLRVLVMTAIMLPLWWFYRRLDWRIDPWAVGLGGVIALYWVLIPVPLEDAPPYGALTGGALILWMVARGLGTTLLVPVIEELFFRDYLERLFRRAPGPVWAIGAAVASAVLFAALHGRWAEAFVASLMFSWLAFRPGGRITDAIIAHMVANGLIFAAALATMRFDII